MIKLKKKKRILYSQKFIQQIRLKLINNMQFNCKIGKAHKSMIIHLIASIKKYRYKKKKSLILIDYFKIMYFIYYL